MDQRILEFIDALRASGVRITLSENIDCFRALEIAGLNDKATFKSTLRSTLVKRTADLPVFEKIFELYFTALVKPLPGGDENEADDDMLPFGSVTLEEFMESFFEGNREKLETLAKLFEWQVGGDFQMALMEQGVAVGLSEISNPLQVGFYSKKMRDSLGWNLLAEEIGKLREELLGSGYSPEEIDRLMQFIERRMNRMAEAVREYVRRELEKNMTRQMEKLKDEEFLSAIAARDRTDARYRCKVGQKDEGQVDAAKEAQKPGSHRR
jgi:uncharacterized protein with von Willebrand factor type A (vWA) domain